MSFQLFEDSDFDQLCRDISSDESFTFSDSDSIDSGDTSTRESVGSSDSGLGDNPKCHRKKYRLNDQLMLVEVQKKTPYVSLSRVVKSDNRRLYTQMFSRVLNSMDFRLMFGFVDQYCSYDVQQLNQKYTSENEPYDIRVQGATTIAMYWHTIQQLAPDSVQTIDSTAFYTSSDSNKCKIVSHFTSKITRIFDMRHTEIVQRSQGIMPVQQHSLVSVGSKRSNLSHPNQRVESQLNVVQSTMDSVQSKLIPRVSPIAITLKGTVTMYVDADCKISKMAFVMEPNVMHVCVM